MPDFWSGKNVIVPGGGGFIGSHLVSALANRGASVTVAARDLARAQSMLEDRGVEVKFAKAELAHLEECRQAIRGHDTVFNLVATVGGIAFNVAHPAHLFYSNAIPCLNLLEASRLENVQLFQCVSSTCVYSTHNSQDAVESNGFEDSPDPTVFGYGWAKRLAELQALMYAKEYAMKISIVRPSNAYGPGDDFSENSSHVIPALIKRIVGHEGEVRVWGSGRQTRSFTYVSDVVEGMLRLAESYQVADPVNIGSHEEISISGLAESIAEISRSPVTFSYDKTLPEGQPRKSANINKLKSILGWQPDVSLREGLTRTINWYVDKFRSVDKASR